MASRASKGFIALLLIAALALVFIGAVGISRRLGEAPPHNGDSLTLYGNIDLREVQLAFNEPARIIRMQVQAGAKVKKGELLAVLDQRRYRADLARAQAQLDGAQSALDSLTAGTRPQDIARLRALVEADSAELEGKRLTYQRIARLVKQKASAQQRLDETRAAMRAAAAHLKADKEALALAIAGPRQENIAAARAKVAAARATLDLAQQALDDTRLYAPSEGVIRNRILEPGDMASPARPVYTLALTNPMWVRAYIDEPNLGRIQTGQPATISSDSFPGKRFKGWIGYISPTAEFTPKTVETTQVRTQLVYQVRVYVCNSDGELRLGMPVTVHVQPKDATRSSSSEHPCKQPAT